MSIKPSRKTYPLNARGRRLVLGERTMIMGVVNLTPDSFSSTRPLRKFHNPRVNVVRALDLIGQGADIIDLGGESTRPHSRPVRVDEEIKRILPTLQLLRKETSKIISVDTYKLEVARRALDAGCDMINNIRGTYITKPFLKLIKKYEAAIVLMHMRGTPQTMHRKTRYRDLLLEIIKELQSSVEKCLDNGINSDRIIIDPGIGFAKTVNQNFLILKNLSLLEKLNCPVLVGTSRKSFIGKILNKEVSERSWGTAATVAAGVLHGAHIVRVHDVLEMKQVVDVSDVILDPSLAI